MVSFLLAFPPISLCIPLAILTHNLKYSLKKAEREEGIKYKSIGCSFSRLIRRPEHLIGRNWYLPAK
jgi:hypothetical protein